ncbi:protein of unknown function (plasmid) [Cupriavidus taiwanensis]|uniref:Uncharacterized protein n=1 Tax=Cupriavidus taiwanensis TaxID=164546 RepID=A0A9Q7XTU3_9BURK|nr:protein of unknown function [Cupriavidus taiwanensis]
MISATYIVFKHSLASHGRVDARTWVGRRGRTPGFAIAASGTFFPLPALRPRSSRR